MTPSNRKRTKRNKALKRTLAKIQQLKQKRKSHTKQTPNWSHESNTLICNGKN